VIRLKNAENRARQ